MADIKYIIISILVFSTLVISCEKFNLERTNPLDPDVNVFLPDLIVQNITVNPSQVSKGNVIYVSFELKNRGNATADYPLWQFDGLYYYLSSNNKFDGSDIELGTSDISDIYAGSLQTINDKTLTIPSGTIPGNYYILIYADKEGDIKESDESNNVGYFLIEVVD